MLDRMRRIRRQGRTVTANVVWRTGTKVGRTIYRNGKLVGLMDTAKLAHLAVDALNHRAAYDPMGGTCKATWLIVPVDGRAFARCVLNPGHLGHHTDVEPKDDNANL